MKNETTRREFLATAGVLGAGLAVGGFGGGFGERAARGERRMGATFFQWREVRDRAWVAIGGGGNSLLLLGTGASMLIDVKKGPQGETLKREALAIIQERKGAPLKYVVNTHHHADHTGGNHSFTKDYEVIAHTKCTDRVLGQMSRYISQAKEASNDLKELGNHDDAAHKAVAELAAKDATQYYKDTVSRKATDFAPKITFDTERDVDLGGMTARLRYLGAGHTDNDIVVHVPEIDVFHTGDLVFHMLHVYPDRSGGMNAKSWIDVLGAAEKMVGADTVVVPGHGEMTDVAGITRQAEYLRAYRGAVEEAIRGGMTRDKVKGLNPMPEQNLNPAARRGDVLTALFDEITSEVGAGTP